MRLSISAREVVSFLHGRGLTEVDVEDRAYFSEASILGVAEDTLAEGGDLSWISPKALQSDPGRASKFRGSLLICPNGPEAYSGDLPFLIPCDRPRLAFAEVVNTLFSEALSLDWPIAKSAIVASDAKIGRRVLIADGVVIGPAVEIADDVAIGPNTCIANTTIKPHVRIGCNCSIGLAGFGYERREDGTHVRFPHLGRVLIDSDVEIGSNVCIDRGGLGVTQISAGVKIDNLVHISHNVRIGRNTLVIANTMIGGSTVVGEGAWLAPSSAIMNKVSIGDRAVVGLGAVVLRSVEQGATVVGNPARSITKKE